MKKICLIIISIVFSCTLSAQEKTLLDYDECKDGVNKSLLKKYEKAVGYYNEKKFQQASLLLQEIIKSDENFASPYFLMGMIGVVKDNTKMIMKYFPLVAENCPDFAHPYLYYYMGMIDYTEERYEKAVKDFEQFLSVTDGDNLYDSLQQVAINYIDWSDFLHQTMENKVPFDPKPINFLAKNKNYYEPFITRDQSQIYFIREEVTKNIDRSSFITEETVTKKRLMQRSVMDSTGFYDKGFVLDDPFNNSPMQGGVSITADNNYIFFSAKNPSSKDNPTWDIYYCERIDDYFTQAKPVNINTNTYDEFSPCVSADGNTLYFVSDRQGGKGGYDIWMSKRNGKNTWDNPVNLGRDVNTFSDETYPFIAADNQKLYFLSNGRKTIGGADIFVYDISKAKPAENIGYPVNTEANEHSVGVCIDGKTAYSVFKNEDNNFYEIKLFTLSEKAQAQERKLVKGIMQKELNGDVSLSLTSLKDRKTVSYYVADEHPDFSLVLKPNENYLLTLEQMGYLFFAKKVNSNTTNLTVIQTPLESGMSMPLNDISFNTNGAGFDDTSMTILDSFVNFLKVNHRIRIILSANKKILSPLKDYLIKSGIRQDRIETKQTENNNIIYTIK